jgi:hypothetical protein
MRKASMYALVLVGSETGLEIRLVVQDQGAFVIITKVSQGVQFPFMVR